MVADRNRLISYSSRFDNFSRALRALKYPLVITTTAGTDRSKSVLLADEPTAALDSFRGRQVMELFRDVARQHGAGVIVVTHDHRTLDVLDTIYEMEDGVIRVSTAWCADVPTA